MKVLSESGVLVDLLMELVRQVTDSRHPTHTRSSMSGWVDLLLDVYLQEGDLEEGLCL